MEYFVFFGDLAIVMLGGRRSEVTLSWSEAERARESEVGGRGGRIVKRERKT